MDHINFRKLNSELVCIMETDEAPKAWAYDTTDGVKTLDVGDAEELTEDYYKFKIITPDYASFILVKTPEAIQIMRNGNPEVLVIVYTGEEGKKYSYQQYKIEDGSLMEDSTMVEIGEGFYYAEPNGLDWSIFVLENELIKVLKVPYKMNGGDGKIILEPNAYQMVAIPVKGKKVKEYFLDKIEEITGRAAEDVIELVKAYPYNDVSDHKFLVFKPGVTKDTNSGNFNLVETDNGKDEITAFYVVTKDFDGTITYEWDSADGDE